MEVARLDTTSHTSILKFWRAELPHKGSAANAACFLTIEVGVDRGKRIITRRRVSSKLIVMFSSSNARALLCYELCSQASEGMWGMPGHTEAMKAVVSCDKLGLAAHTH